MISTYCHSQSKTDSLALKHIVIKDRLFKKEIEKFSMNKIKSDSLFSSGKGYLELVKKSTNNLSEGILEQYYLNANFIDYDVIPDGKILPLYYTYTDTKCLVLIYDSSLSTSVSSNFKLDSKKLLQQLLQPFLPDQVVMEPIDGNILPAKRRESYHIQLHGGINIIHMKDGTYRTITSSEAASLNKIK